MLHLEPGHRIMAEALAARIHAPPDRREAVDVRCSDFGVQYSLCVPPEQQNVLKLSVWVRCFAEVVEGVGEAFFAEQLYPGMVQPPEPGYSLTLALDLDALPPEEEARNELVRKLSCVGRDVLGAPLRVALLALLGGAAPPRPYYAVHHREGEAMYVVPKAATTRSPRPTPSPATALAGHRPRRPPPSPPLPSPPLPSPPLPSPPLRPCPRQRRPHRHRRHRRRGKSAGHPSSSHPPAPTTRCRLPVRATLDTRTLRREPPARPPAARMTW